MSLLMIASCAPAAAQGGGGGGFPDLETDYGVPWTVVWPTAPTTTSQSTVSNASEFNTAKAVAGTEITMAAGSYGDLTLSGTDLRVIVQGGVTIGGLDIGVCQRVILEFETPRDATSVIKYINCGSAFDHAIDNFLADGVRTFDADATSHGSNWCGRGVALINSYLQTNHYGIFSDQGTEGRPTNMTFYNNTVDSGNVNGGGTPQSLFRFTGCERMVMCRNRLIKNNDGQMGRIYSKSDTWISDNQFEATGSWNNPGGSWDSSDAADSGTPVNTSYGVRVVSNICNNNGGGAGGMVNEISGMNASSVGTYLFQDNVSYSGFAWPSSGPSAAYTFTNNSNSAYQAPAAWSYA